MQLNYSKQFRQFCENNKQTLTCSSLETFAGGATAVCTKAASSPTSTEAIDVALFCLVRSPFLPPLDVKDRVQDNGPFTRDPPDDPEPPPPVLESIEEALLRGMVANVVLLNIFSKNPPSNQLVLCSINQIGIPSNLKIFKQTMMFIFNFL